MKAIKNVLTIMLVSLVTFSFSLGNSGLSNIQSRIEKAMLQSFEAESDSALLEILIELDSMSNMKNQHWVEYWRAYTLYHKAIYEAYGLKNSELAQATVKATIELLKGIEDKNSEDFALLAHIQGFKLQWVSGMSIVAESGKAETWGQKAIQLGPANPRAYFVSGNYDYHKPAFFGGGKKAKDLLEKSLELYKDSFPNPLMPSWGMGDAYAMLVMVHMRAEKNEDANVILEEGLQKFPDHRDLNRLKKKLQS